MAGYSRSPQEIPIKRRRLEDGSCDRTFVNEESSQQGWFGGRLTSFLARALSPITNFWQRQQSLESTMEDAKTTQPRRIAVPRYDSNGISNQRLHSPRLSDLKSGDTSRAQFISSHENRVGDASLFPSSVSSTTSPYRSNSDTRPRLSENDDIYVIEDKLRRESVLLHLNRKEESRVEDDDIVVLPKSSPSGDLSVSSKGRFSLFPSALTTARCCDVKPNCSKDSIEDEEIRILEEKVAREDDEAYVPDINIVGGVSKRNSEDDVQFVKIVKHSEDDDVQYIGCSERKVFYEKRSPFLPAREAAELRESYGLSPADIERDESFLPSRHGVCTVFEEQQEEASTFSGSASSASGTEVASGPSLTQSTQEAGSSVTEEVSTPFSFSPTQWNSASRTATPLFSHSRLRNHIDKFGRRKSVDSSKLWRVRPQPFWSHAGGKEKQTEKFASYFEKSRFNKLYNGDRDESAINMGAKERYRRLLEDLSIGCNILGRSDFEPKKSKTSRFAQVSPTKVLERGKTVLEQIFSGSVTPVSASPSVRSEVSSTDGRATSEESDLATGRVMAPSGGSTRTSSFSDTGLETTLNQLREKTLDRTLKQNAFTTYRSSAVNEAFEAKLETDKSSSAIARDRLIRHKQESELRQKRAKALALEKQLRETARRDEEIVLEEEIRKKLTVSGYIFRDRRIKIEKDEFPALTDEIFTIIDNVWYGGHSVDQKFGERITRKDLLTLRGLEWLNDEVIDTYLGLVCDRGKEDSSLPKVYAFTTFFYTNLAQHGFAKVKRWTRKVDIFSYDILLVPVHLGAHWCLAVVDFSRKCIEYYDSMGGSNTRCLEALRSYLNDESLDKKKKPFDTTGWKFYCRKDIPQQMNGSDCGMFACKFAEFASRRAKVAFDQEHMPYYRQRMVYEIYQKALM